MRRTGAEQCLADGAADSVDAVKQVEVATWKDLAAEGGGGELAPAQQFGLAHETIGRARESGDRAVQDIQ